MIRNETMQSILARRSYKAFQGDPISDEILETILEAGKYAPTGMNGQPWHFTVVKSDEAKAKYKAAVKAMTAKGGAGGPPPGAPMPAPAPGVVSVPEDDMRGAPILILVSADTAHPTAMQDALLATENLYVAAASLGVMSGWSHMTVKDLFCDPEVKKQFDIPEGYDVYSASFFGYPLGETKDRGPRKAGTVTIL